MGASGIQLGNMRNPKEKVAHETQTRHQAHTHRHWAHPGLFTRQMGILTCRVHHPPGVHAEHNIIQEHSYTNRHRHTQTCVQMSLTETLTGKHAQPQAQRHVPKHKLNTDTHTHTRLEDGITLQTHRLACRSTDKWKTHLMFLTWDPQRLLCLFGFPRTEL